MDMMEAVAFRRPAQLAAEAVALAGAVTLHLPVWTVIVGGVAPQAQLFQSIDRLNCQGDPISGGQQVDRRQGQLFDWQVFVGIPAHFAVAGQLGGDLDLAAGFEGANDRLGGV